MSHDPSFEERLAQLNARSRVKATPAVHPVPESGGRSRTFAIFGLVSGVLLVLAAAGLALWPRGENPMGAYASALAQVFPGKTIEIALLWTRTATLMHLPHDLVTELLQNTQMLDAVPGET